MAVQDDVKKIMKLKEELDSAKLDKARLEGSLQQLLQQLKDEHKLQNLDAAEKYLEKLKKEHDDTEEELREIVEDLENEYEWD